MMQNRRSRPKADRANWFFLHQLSPLMQIETRGGSRHATGRRIAVGPYLDYVWL